MPLALFRSPSDVVSWCGEDSRRSVCIPLISSASHLPPYPSCLLLLSSASHLHLIFAHPSFFRLSHLHLTFAPPSFLPLPPSPPPPSAYESPLPSPPLAHHLCLKLTLPSPSFLPLSPPPLLPLSLSPFFFRSRPSSPLRKPLPLPSFFRSPPPTQPNSP